MSAVSTSDKQILLMHSVLLRLGKLSVRDFAATINALSNSGVYHDVFYDILFPSEYYDDFVQAAEISLRQLEISIPASVEDAVFVLADITTWHISRGTEDPLEHLARFWVYLDWSSTFVAAFGLDELQAIDWEYDHLCCESGPETSKSLARLEAECRKAATKWRRDHGLS